MRRELQFGAAMYAGLVLRVGAVGIAGQIHQQRGQRVRSGFGLADKGNLLNRALREQVLQLVLIEAIDMPPGRICSAARVTSCAT